MKTIEIQPPLGGVNKAFAFQRQPPYTTPYALNVTPYDALGQRMRLGSRPGMAKAVSAQFDASDKAACMFTTVKQSTGVQYVVVFVNDGSAPTCVRYASGSWSTATGSINATTYRVVPVPVQQVTTAMGSNTVVGSLATAGDVYLFSKAWSGSYIYKAETNSVASGVSLAAPAISGMQFQNRVWYIQSARKWSNGDDTPDGATTGEIEIQNPSVSNEELTGCIGWTADYALFTTPSATVLLAGSPLLGGRFWTVSNRYGMLDPLSYCKGPNNDLYVLCKEGVVKWSAGNPHSPVLLNAEKMPASLRNIDPTAYTATLAYDVRRNGIDIFLSKNSSAANQDHWYLDLYNGGFWLRNYHVNVEPFAVCNLPTAATGFTASDYTDVLVACRDGYVRQFDPTSATDDSNAVTSTVFVGPLLGDTMATRGIVAELLGALASGGGSVAWSIHVGSTAEEAYAASAAFSGTWTAGLNAVARPQMRCHSWYLKLTATSTKWAWEYVTAVMQAAGRNW